MSATPALYLEPLLLLGGAVVAAPIFKKLGLGTVLGYLAAGIVIGPVAQLIVDSEQILSVSELGIVFLLFVIGLELKPSRLWQMRRRAQTAVWARRLAAVFHRVWRPPPGAMGCPAVKMPRRRGIPDKEREPDPRASPSSTCSAWSSRV